MKTFEQFYTEWYDYTVGILQYKFEYKHNEVAQDLAQDVMIKVHSAMERGMYDGANDKGWLGFVINNTFLDEVRRWGRSREFNMIVTEDGEYYDIKDTHAPVEDVIIKEEWLEELESCIHMLNDDFIEVVMMVMLGDMTHKEYAEAKGCSINTSLGRARYSVKALKEMMVNQ